MKIQDGLYLSLTAFAALAVPAAFAQGSSAQTGPSQAASAPATTAAPITLPVTVVNDHGDPVKNLSASTLTLVDNGHPQKIDSFSLAQPAPASIGILVQTSPDLRFELGDARLAGVRFVDHTIPGSDNKFFVIQFSNEVDLLENPTSDVNKLHDAINHLGAPQSEDQNGGDQPSSDRHQAAFGANLYDAIYLACTEVLKQQPGRHILIVLTDGVDRGSKEGYNEAVQAAQSTNTMVFSIYYRGEVQRSTAGEPGTSRRSTGPGFPGGVGLPGGGGGYPRGGDRRRNEQPQQSPETGEKLLEQLGNATGGYKVVGKHDKAEDGFDKLAALLKNPYTLTWTPDSATAASPSHHITLSTREKGVFPIVQANYTTHP